MSYFNKKTCDNCHQCTPLVDPCKLHDKKVCTEGADCIYYWRPDCALVCYYVNKITPTFDYDNFSKKHRACELRGICDMRSDLKLIAQNCDCDGDDGNGNDSS